MTRSDFRNQWIANLQEFPWAKDPAKLANFVDGIDRTLDGAHTVDISGPACLAAWKACGGKGKPTYKAIHALT